MVRVSYICTVCIGLASTIKERVESMKNITFNHDIEKLKTSASVDLMDRVAPMRANGEKVINLSVGEPDFNTPSAVSLAGIGEITKGNTHYTTSRGIVPLRQRIAHKLEQENNIPCGVKNVLVSPGGKFSIYLAIRTMVNSGDEVMILDPSWVSYAPIVQASGGVPVAVGLSFEDNYAITKKVLESKLSPKTRVMIVNSPNNPTGRMLTENEAEQIAKFVQKNNLVVVADEIYEKIIFDRRQHISLGSIPEIADRVITVGGFSKSAAMTGWRLGYLAAHEEIIEKIYPLFVHTITCVGGFVQEAGIVALDCAEEIESMRRSYEFRRNLFVGALRKIPGVTCNYPEGTFYAWARIEKGNMTSLEMSRYLLEEAHVAAVPGDAFGLGSDKCLRFCFAAPVDDLEEAAEKIADALSRI